MTINCRGRLLSVDKPLIMGVVNCTPDSFYAGSRSASDGALQTALRLVEEDADILDIGGQSTRPGADRLSPEEEWTRIGGLIRELHARFPELVISVDTFYASVAARAVEAGASIINDVSAGSLDPRMIPLAGSLIVPFLCMHMKGDPKTMQSMTTYDDLLVELFAYFNEKIAACTQAGIRDVIIDPGFGFAKTIAQNFELLRNLSVFRTLGRPLLVGLSRKSTVYKTLGIAPEEALNGTTVLNTVALLHGADILRVHDVKEAKEAVKLVMAMSYNYSSTASAGL